MKLKPINKKKKRIYTAILLLLAIAVMQKFYPLWEHFFIGTDDIEISEQLVVSYTHKLQKKRQLASRLDILRKALKRAEASFLRAKTPALATADVQNTINRIADQTGTEISRIRILDPLIEEDINYLSIPVTVTIHATVRQLIRVMHKIMASPKMLRIQDVSVQLGKNQSTDNIRATFTVSGTMKPIEEGKRSK